ncbi:restriction endonuclease subunit S [uncultured Methanobrevibacter sp.]|uniref:restriction endonuclease subunit S n=1 Tax=uncultured Methanobrevibacter sp. TaxID=253161 RepID=UPI0025EEFD30|nr:restriction endonuclease subunit S [uncultured Methanobrevibacter sp.]
MSLEWESCKIGELGKIFSGGTPSTKIKEYWDGDLNWLSSGETRNTYIYATDKFITEEGANNSSTKLANKGDIVIASAGQGFTRGQSSMVMIDTYVNQSVIVISPNDKVNIHYLLYNLKFRYPELRQLSDHASTRGSLTTKIIKDLDIILPDLNTQNKIATIIQYFDKKIETNKKINKNLEEQLSLIFDDYFVKCSDYDEDSLVKTDWGKIPKEWKNIDFGELIQITSGDRPDEKSETKTDDFNIPLFGASKIMGYTKEFSYDEDILIIGRVGTHGVVQRVNYPCFPSDNTFVIKSKYYGFVYQLLKRIDYDSLNTGSTQPLITQKSLKMVNVVLPDENSLFEFENISKVFFDKIYINQNEIGSLTKLRDTLLPKLMSGEIDVSKINCDLE